MQFLNSTQPTPDPGVASKRSEDSQTHTPLPIGGAGQIRSGVGDMNKSRVRMGG